MFENKKKGFTLVELIAVLCILAVIMVIVIPKGDKNIENSKKIAIKAEAKAIVDVAMTLKGEGYFKDKKLEDIKLSEIYSTIGEDKLKDYFETPPVRISNERWGHIQIYYYKLLANEIEINRIHLLPDGEGLKEVDNWG